MTQVTATDARTINAIRENDPEAMIFVRTIEKRWPVIPGENPAWTNGRGESCVNVMGLNSAIPLHSILSICIRPKTET